MTLNENRLFGRHFEIVQIVFPHVYIGIFYCRNQLKLLWDFTVTDSQGHRLLKENSKEQTDWSY